MTQAHEVLRGYDASASSLPPTSRPKTNVFSVIIMSTSLVIAATVTAVDARTLWLSSRSASSSWTHCSRALAKASLSSLCLNSSSPLLYCASRYAMASLTSACFSSSNSSSHVALASSSDSWNSASFCSSNSRTISSRRESMSRFRFDSSNSSCSERMKRIPRSGDKEQNEAQRISRWPWGARNPDQSGFSQREKEQRKAGWGLAGHRPAKSHATLKRRSFASWRKAKPPRPKRRPAATFLTGNPAISHSRVALAQIPAYITHKNLAVRKIMDSTVLNYTRCKWSRKAREYCQGKRASFANIFFAESFDESGSKGPHLFLYFFSLVRIPIFHTVYASPQKLARPLVIYHQVLLNGVDPNLFRKPPMDHFLRAQR